MERLPVIPEDEPLNQLSCGEFLYTKLEDNLIRKIRFLGKFLGLYSKS